MFGCELEGETVTVRGGKGDNGLCLCGQGGARDRRQWCPEPSNRSTRFEGHKVRSLHFIILLLVRSDTKQSDLLGYLLVPQAISTSVALTFWM